jgi:uncharacterized protein YqgV (UPF0045/DUF77 family)
MKLQAEVSLYPLRQKDLAKPVGLFCELLRKDEIEIHTGPMSSLITADSDVIFCSLKEAFEQLAKEYEVVLTAKISNACPECKEK